MVIFFTLSVNCSGSNIENQSGINYLDDLLNLNGNNR